jgi:PAS domain S-box-containing protein
MNDRNDLPETGAPAPAAPPSLASPPPRLLERALAATGSGVIITDPALPDNPIVYCNPAFERITGYGAAETVGRNCRFLQGPETDPGHVAEIRGAIRAGRECRVTLRNYRKDGCPFWNDLIISPVHDETGRLVNFIGVQSDVSARVDAEAERARAVGALEAEREMLAAVNRTGQMLAAELDLQKLVQAVTDAATALTGAQFGAFFYNVVDPAGAGEAYTLYTLSGVPPEAFARFPMPRNTEIFAPTFRGEGVVRSDDITRDPRYGTNAPHAGMPPGHLPVKSYLAVPVISRSGEVLGGLFFGHPESGVFGEREERSILGLAAQAAVAMDNAALFRQAQHEIDERKRAEAALRENQQRIRAVLREIVASVTEGKLRLCETPADLPVPLGSCGPPVTLSRPNLRALRRRTTEAAEARGLPEERWQDLLTGVGEASMNAVVHGGGGEAWVCAGAGDANGDYNGTVQVWVRDRGKGIAMDQLHRATLERGFTTTGTLGHGFWMMLKAVDRIWLLTGASGTTVVLEQDRDPAPTTWFRRPPTSGDDGNFAAARPA